MGNWLCGRINDEVSDEGITTEVIKAEEEHYSTVIFLHGLGDNGYDIYGMSTDAPQDEAGIAGAADLVAKIVKAEVEREGIPLERIILGGFSQGGSVAIYSSLTAASLRGLAGVFILSSWLPLSQVLSHDPSKVTADKTLRILQCHGTADPLLPDFIGDLTNKLLKKIQFNDSEFHKIKDLGHAYNEEEMGYVQLFINKALNK